MKGNWWETPSLVAYTDTAYKLFEQGLIAANTYAGFCQRSLLWCAATSLLKKRKRASAAEGFGKFLIIFCPSNMLWKICLKQAYLCVWEREGSDL